jgi:predicted HTH transcriptional regulator
MSHYNDVQLEAMMADLESDRAERKQSFQGDAPQKVREAVCAFANDLPAHGEPGVVLIGVHDNGRPMPGFVVTDELLRSLADIKTDGNIVPPPSLLVEKRILQGCEVAVISVCPCDTPPVRYKGRIHVRWGPRRGLATAQDERILNERRRHHDRPFDVQPVRDAEMEDLDRLRFEQEYLPALVARDVATEERGETYPMDALRQLVRNAYMHRSYEATNTPVRVYWFDDRIEIHNPGGPFGSVTPENFGQPGITDYRNPNLAEALRALGYVQRFGAGIAIARKALGQRLQFEVQAGVVAAIIQGESS